VGHSLLVPYPGATAQEADVDTVTTEVLGELPSTGARRPGPVILAAARVATTEPATTLASVEGVAPAELQIDSVGVAAPIEPGNVTDGVMQDPAGPWVASPDGQATLADFGFEPVA
jgi:hypothetical protein